MPVSLIATVLNEGDNLRTLLDSICAQTRLPDEVVISDGGSTDNTVAVLRDYAERLPLKIVDAPGANISAGRNVAIQATSHDVIAVTDAGVQLDPNWLARLIVPFEANSKTHAVAGFFKSDTQTPFEVGMGATVLPEVSEINPATFMPSSRSVAFRRETWESVGGYPEWLDFGEDLVFDFRIAALNGPFPFAPDALAFYRPRQTLRAFLKQYYLYARGDGKADLFPRRHAIRYLTYFAALPILIVAAVVNSPLWLLAFVPGAAYMLGRPYRRLINQWGGLTFAEKIIAALWVPVIRISGDWAKMVGYPVGLVWRARNHPPEWRIEEPEEAKAAWLARLLEIDARISARLNVSGRPGISKTLASLVTHSADGPVLWAILAAIAVFGSSYARAAAGLTLILDLGVGLVVQIVKVVMQRPRPPGEWGQMVRRIDPHSFPSGHSGRGGMLTVVGLMLGPPWMQIALPLWGTLIALSRVLMGVHFALDALVGYVMGVAITAAILTVLL